MSGEILIEVGAMTKKAASLIPKMVTFNRSDRKCILFPNTVDSQKEWERGPSDKQAFMKDFKGNN